MGGSTRNIGGESPWPTGLNVKIITENRARLAALQTGEVQVAWLQAEQVHEAQKDPNIKVWSFAGVGWDGWAWADWSAAARRPAAAPCYGQSHRSRCPEQSGVP